MTANDSTFYLLYLNKIVNQYENVYHQFTDKKPNNADCSALIKTIETNANADKFKVKDRVRITNFENIFSKDCTKNY